MDVIQFNLGAGFKYACHEWPNAWANHFPVGWINLYRKVWNALKHPLGLDNRVGGVWGVAIVLMHEHLHHTLLGGLKDIRHDICETSLGKRCYGPANARKLVATGNLWAAYNNIENYVHWAAARYFFFGDCAMFDPSSQRVSCDGSVIIGPTGSFSVQTCCDLCLDGDVGGCITTTIY